MERALPYNIEAEQGFLGSLIIDPDAISHVIDLVQPEDFYRDTHKTLYRQIVRLYHEQMKSDPITLGDALERANLLEDIGGQGYLASLMVCVPTSGNVDYYARIIARDAVARRLVHASGQIAALAYSKGDQANLLEQAMQLLMEVQGAQHGGQEESFSVVLDRLLEETYNRMDGAISQHLLKTGLTALDVAITGIEPGELILLAGRPGSGKSVFGLSVAENVATQVKPQGGTVFYYTLEMGATQQVRRMLSAKTRINSQLIRIGFRGPYGDLAEPALDRFVNEAQRMRELLGETLYIHSKPISVDALYGRLCNAVATKHCRFVVIDQLDLFEDSRREHEQEQISHTSKRLKQIARELNIPILCLVQLNRQLESRPGLLGKRPMLPDLRYSGRLEQDADQVWFLFHPSMYEERPDTPAWREYSELCLGKVRDGQRGAAIPYRFLEQFTAIEDWPKEWAMPEMGAY
jgi:replicative DNA helicase